MKKFIFTVLFCCVSIFSFGQTYTYTPNKAYVHGEEEGEFFNYTLTDSIEYYEIKLYGFLPSVGDDNYLEGKQQINGYVNAKGLLLLKLTNDSIMSFTYSNVKNKYYHYRDYKYYITTIHINKNDMNKIANVGVKKIRIETNTAFIDLKSNIFSKINIAYINMEKQFNTNNAKNIYTNF